MKKLTRTILWAVVFLSLYILFHSAFERAWTKLLVSPFISQIAIDGKVMSMASYLVIVILIIGWVIRKLKKGFKFSDAWFVWSITFCSVYIYYRFYSNVWTFESFWGEIKALDILMIFPILFIISAIKNYRTIKDVSIQQSSGFLHDDPLTIEKENDPYERHRFIVEIKERILRTPNGSSAFCIGVEGVWGAGKTTFLKTLKKELVNSKDVIQFDFNPWTKPNNSNLLEIFFNEFSYHLGGYTDMLHAEIEKYAKILVGGNTLSIFSRGAHYFFPSLRLEQSNAEAAKEQIEDALRGLGKKVVIYIDDIDRLDHGEVAEVFKLVRNSAGFSGVFYVIAFDRSQVEIALKGNFDQNSHTFLDKVLQVEFHLPPPNSNVLFASLIKGLDQRISKSESDFLHTHIIENIDINKPSLLWVRSFFNQPRDVIRFLNQFDFHYAFVKGEVFLPDFLALMILRFKYPRFAQHFSYDRFKYLTFKNEYHQILEREGELIMEGVDPSYRNFNNYIAYRPLRGHKT